MFINKPRTEGNMLTTEGITSYLPQENLMTPQQRDLDRSYYYDANQMVFFITITISQSTITRHTFTISLPN